MSKVKSPKTTKDFMPKSKEPVPTNEVQKDTKGQEYSQKVMDSGVKGYQKRLLVGTPTTGLIRMEWAAARYGQAIPANWSKIDMIQYMTSFIPLRYTVADAQNIIVNEVVTNNYEWLLLIEHDTIPPADAFIQFNEYMRDGSVPVVSGLYFTRSEPSEPLIYRGRGNSYYTDWKFGDKVWVDGVPTGMLLIHSALLKSIWEDSPEYAAGGLRMRRVFETPVRSWFDPEKGTQEVLTGTSDLDWCKRIMEGGHLAKAGWPELQDKEFPFLVDTNIFCKHIDPDGQQFPKTIPPEFIPDKEVLISEPATGSQV